MSWCWLALVDDWPQGASAAGTGDVSGSTTIIRVGLPMFTSKLLQATSTGIR